MKNEDIKTSRASQTRAKTTATKTWTPPSSLDAPEPPIGYRHRWIRAETMGFNDTKNVAASLREGYELVRAEDYPDQDFPVETTGKYAGVIGVGGLLLAKIPEEIAKQIEAYYDQQTKDKDDAINNDLLKDQHPSMPINSERQTRVTFGGTKK
jgi:hypothetical protein|tara:strand:+ start:460 stop:918 length:459 start_codon:yes stop_codon:yes gene_type:complete